MNPFVFGSVVTGAQFIDRRATIRELGGYFRAAQHCLLHGHRRIGKTSLLMEVARRTRRDVDTVYVDLMGVKTIDALCARILRAALRAQSLSTKLMKALGSLPRLRPVFQPQPDGSIGVAFQAPRGDDPLTLEDALEGVRRVKGARPLVLVLDEFQDVATLPDADTLYAVVRGAMQLPERIGYVFCGSRRSLLTHIFQHSESPLFKSVAMLPVGPVEPDELLPSVAKLFASGSRAVTRACLDEVYEIADGITSDVQQLCQMVWTLTDEGDTIDEAVLARAVERVLDSQRVMYEDWIRQLTAFQFAVMRSLANLGGTEVFGHVFLEDAGTRNPSSVRKALARFAERDLIYEEESIYRFVHPFFREWLRRTFPAEM